MARRAVFGRHGKGDKKELAEEDEDADKGNSKNVSFDDFRREPTLGKET